LESPSADRNGVPRLEGSDLMALSHASCLHSAGCWLLLRDAPANNKSHLCTIRDSGTFWN